MVKENKYLKSIKEILPEECYFTNGSKPVRVLAENWNEYICKYYSNQGFASVLFNEYIAASFLKIWKLNVPDFTFIQVQKNHLKQVEFPYHYFRVPCFGSLFGKNYKELDKFFLTCSFRNEDVEKLFPQILKIGLFDIWLSNEDRNFGNMNLMIDLEKVNFVPIDHVQIFNSNTIDNEAVQLTPEDSILTSPFMIRNFLRPLQLNCKDLRTTYATDFSTDLQHCHENLDKILENVPPEWCLDSDFIKSRLDYFFSSEWQEKTLSSFCTFIQIALNRKK